MTKGGFHTDVYFIRSRKSIDLAQRMLKTFNDVNLVLCITEEEFCPDVDGPGRYMY